MKPLSFMSSAECDIKSGKPVQLYNRKGTKMKSSLAPEKASIVFSTVTYIGPRIK